MALHSTSIDGHGGAIRAMELMLRNDEICRSFLAFLRSDGWRETIATSPPPRAHPHDAERLVLFLLETRAHDRQVRAWTQAQAQAQAQSSAPANAHSQRAAKAAAIAGAAATSASMSAERIVRTFITPHAPRRIPLPLACSQRLLRQRQDQGQRLRLIDAAAEAMAVPAKPKSKQVEGKRAREQEQEQKGSRSSGASSSTPSVEADQSSTNACLHLDFSEARSQALRQLSRRPLRAFVRGSNNDQDHHTGNGALGVSTDDGGQFSLLPTLRRAVEAMRITALSRSQPHSVGQSESSGARGLPATTPRWQQDQKLLPLLLQQRRRVRSSEEKSGADDTSGYCESNSDSDSDSDSDCDSDCDSDSDGPSDGHGDGRSTHSALISGTDVDDVEQSTPAEVEDDALLERETENGAAPACEPKHEPKSDPKAQLESTPESASAIEPESSMGSTFEGVRETEPRPDSADSFAGRCIKLHVKVAGARALRFCASPDATPDNASGTTGSFEPAHGDSSSNFKPAGACASEPVQEVAAPYVVVACRSELVAADENGPWERAIGSTATPLKISRKEGRSDENAVQEMQQMEKHKREKQRHEWRWHDHFNFACDLPGRAGCSDGACVRLLLRVLDADRRESAAVPNTSPNAELDNCIGEASVLLEIGSEDVDALINGDGDHTLESKRKLWRGHRWLQLRRGGVDHGIPIRWCDAKGGHDHSNHKLEHDNAHSGGGGGDAIVCGEIDVSVSAHVCDKHEHADGCARNFSESPSLDPGTAIGPRRVVCVAADTLVLSVRGPTNARPGPVLVLSANDKRIREGDVIVAVRLWEDVGFHTGAETGSRESKAPDQDSDGTSQAGNGAQPRRQLHTYRTAKLLFESGIVPLLKRLKQEGGELIIFASPMLQTSEPSSSTNSSSLTTQPVSVERHSNVDHGKPKHAVPAPPNPVSFRDQTERRSGSDGRPRMLETRAHARARRRTMREVQEKAAAAEIAAAAAAAKSSRPRLPPPAPPSADSQASTLSSCRMEKLHFFRMSVRTRKRSGINSRCNAAGEMGGNAASTLVASPASTTSTVSVASSKSADHHHEHIMCTAVLDLSSRLLLFYRSPSGVPLVLSGHVKAGSARGAGNTGRSHTKATAAARRGGGDNTTNWLQGGIPLGSIRSVLPDNEPDLSTRRIFVLLQKGQSLELRCQSARVATEFCRCVLENIATLSESTNAARQQLPLSSPSPPPSVDASSAPGLLNAASNIAGATDGDFGFIGNVFMRCSAMSPNDGDAGSDAAKWGARTLLLCNHDGVLVAFDPGQSDPTGRATCGSDIIDLAETPPLFALHLDGLVLHHQGAKSFVLRPKLFDPEQSSDSISIRVGIARRATASTSGSDPAATWTSKLRSALNAYAHHTQGSEREHRRHKQQHIHVHVEDPNHLLVAPTLPAPPSPGSPSPTKPDPDSVSVAAAACADAKERCLRADFEGARAVLHAAFTRTDGVRGADLKTGPCAQLHTWVTAVHSFIVAFIERRTLSPAQRAGLLLKATNTGALELFQVHLVELLLDTASACTEAGLVLEAQKITRTLTALNEEHESDTPPRSPTAFAASSPSLLSPTQMRRLHTLKQRASTRNTGDNVPLLRRRTAAGTSRPSPRTPRRWRM